MDTLHNLRRSLRQSILARLGIPDDDAEPTAAPSIASANRRSSTDPSYEPSPMDVIIVKMMLHFALKLPAEVVLSIFDFAEYWPHTTAELDQSMVIQAGGGRENQFLLRTKPLGFIKPTHNDKYYYMRKTAEPLLLYDGSEYPLEQFQKWIGGPTDIIKHPCRKIVFTITSHDQGWANNARLDRGTYRGSYTWFEAGLERFDKTAIKPKANNEEAEAAVAMGDDELGEKALLKNDKTSEASSSSTKPKKGLNLPEPYLPVYALRSKYPTVDSQRNPPIFHHDLLASPEYTIQYNKTATRDDTTHRVEWSWKDGENPLTDHQLRDLGRGIGTGNGEFVRSLKPGDVVTVWGKTRFGGWANHIKDVKVDVYWAL